LQIKFYYNYFLNKQYFDINVIKIKYMELTFIKHYII